MTITRIAVAMSALLAVACGGGSAKQDAAVVAVDAPATPAPDAAPPIDAPPPPPDARNPECPPRADVVACTTAGLVCEYSQDYCVCEDWTPHSFRCNPSVCRPGEASAFQGACTGDATCWTDIEASCRCLDDAWFCCSGTQFTQCPASAPSAGQPCCYMPIEGPATCTYPERACTCSAATWRWSCP